MLQLTMSEARLITGRRTNVVSRMFPGRAECPIHPGGMDVLVDPQGTRIARVQIRSVRRDSLEARRRDDDLAKSEGFTNAISWFAHLRQRYGMDDGFVYRIQFAVQKPVEDGPVVKPHNPADDVEHIEAPREW